MLLLSANATADSLLPLLVNCSDCSHQSQAPPTGTRPTTPPLEAPPPVGVAKALLLGLVLGLFLVLGVVGNVLVLLSVVLQRPLRSATRIFIANLALADLLLSALVLPFSALLELRGRWMFGRAFCDVWAALDVLCCTASILSLCVIAADRYVGVSYPLRYPALVTSRRAAIALVCVWTLAACVSVGPLVGWKEAAPEDEGVCGITEEPAYALFSACVSFYVPLCVLCVLYTRVYVVARRETHALAHGTKTERSDDEHQHVTLRVHRGNALTHTHTAEDEAPRKRNTHLAVRLLKFSREKRAAKTLGIVVGCFILCWLPFFIVLPIGSMFPAYRPSESVFKVTFWLGYFNSCMNPLIYPCSSPEFKRAFLSLLRGQCHRRHGYAKKLVQE
ncbi:adrenoceptor alpha 1Aa [Engraulis encrasicolus]|uniref:adrenoceptor alpha 1Aa n=1 Tax=Engraulis encrasicolus TaxID=184585 RepID=UPI002FCF9881